MRRLGPSQGQPTKRRLWLCIENSFSGPGGMPRRRNRRRRRRAFGSTAARLVRVLRETVRLRQTDQFKRIIAAHTSSRCLRKSVRFISSCRFVRRASVVTILAALINVHSCLHSSGCRYRRSSGVYIATQAHRDVRLQSHPLSCRINGDRVQLPLCESVRRRVSE